MKHVLIALAMLILATGSVQAQDSRQMAEEIKRMRQQIESLERAVTDLRRVVIDLREQVDKTQGFTQSGGGYVFDATGPVTIKARVLNLEAVDFRFKATGQATLQGGASLSLIAGGRALLQASGELKLKASSITQN